jgi:protein-ribulosamine 3-kinase
VTDPTDMDSIQRQRDKLLEDTGAWVLSHDSFTKWLNARTDCTIWIHGDPGKGKTMLAVSLVQEMTARITHEGMASTTALAYFFCDNKDSRRNSAASILRGIIYQLLCQKPELCIYLRDPYEWKIFQNIVSHGSFERIFFIVDALDECDPESLETLLTLLEPYTERQESEDAADASFIQGRKLPPKIKWLLTSRNELLIQQRLTDCLDVSLEKNFAEVDISVRRFVTVKVEQLRKRKGYNPALCDFIKSTLQQRSEGTFLWVALACRELAKPKVMSLNTKIVLLKLPAGLSSLYGRILDQVLQFEDEDFVTHAKAILRAMVVAFQPMSLLELGVTARLPAEHRADSGCIEEYLSVCGSLVTIRNNIAYFVHQSAKTYILDNSIGIIISIDISADHRFLALNCFEHVSERLATGARRFSDTANKDDHPMRLDYPTLFWADHMRTSTDDVADEVDVHAEFFQSKSIYRQAWLDHYWQQRHAKWEVKPGGFSACHVLAYAGLTPVLRKLLSRRSPACSISVDSLGNNPLAWAARNGFEDTVSLLINSGVDVTLQNNEGMTALQWAAGNGHAKIVQHLYDHGADIETADKNSWNPLHRAACNGHAHVVKLLIGFGANVEALDGSTWTAMHRAATMGQTEVVRLLIEQKAAMDILDREGMTPMLHAAWAGQDDVIRLFLASGVDVNEKDYNEWTALHNAAWNGHLSTVIMLLKCGVDVHAKNADGSTALHHATWSGYDKVVEVLLEAGTDVDAIAHDENDTPLHQAAWRSHLGCIQLLLSRSPQINMQNTVGHTALHHAATTGNKTIIQTLLDHGADPRIVDKHGHLPRTSAASNDHDTVAAMLREAELERASDTDGTVTPVELPLVDINVAKALYVDHQTSTVQPHQAAGFFVPEKITANVDGKKKYFYMKSGTKQDMFESKFLHTDINSGRISKFLLGEYISLERLHEAVPTLVPRPIAWGKFASTETYYLVTEWIDEDTDDSGRGRGTDLSLAQKVAKLHKTSAPIPPGYSKPMFGFPMTTYCGSTAQRNDWTSSWADFYGECRLRHICRLIEENHGTDEELNELLKMLVERVVPRLLGDGHLGGAAGVQPVLIHGDLWEGNRSKGKFDDRDGIEPVTYDPSCSYAHSEFELCLMRMFGGFSAGFFNEYHQLVPKTNPKIEYDDRMDLYELLVTAILSSAKRQVLT